MGARKAIGDAMVSLGEGIKPAEAESPLPPAKTPAWLVFLTFLGAIALLVVGTLVLVAGRDMWENPEPPTTSAQPTKVEKKVVKKPVKKGGKKQGRGRPFVISRQVTIERASQDGGRSETVGLAILATGAALLLGGGFAARLTSIKLPGVEMSAAALSGFGAGVKAATETSAEVVAEAQKSGKQDVLEDKDKLAEATSLAMQQGRQGVLNELLAAMAASAAPATAPDAQQEKEQAVAEAVRKVSDV
jgi:hypothetical protein